MALRTWLLSWLQFSDSMGWIGGSGLVYLKMEPVLFILAYMIFLSCSRLITWVNFLVCKIRTAQIMVFTAAGNCLVSCYSCTGNTLNLAWEDRKLAWSKLIQVVLFFNTYQKGLLVFSADYYKLNTSVWDSLGTNRCLSTCTLLKFNSRSDGSDSLVPYWGIPNLDPEAQHSELTLITEEATPSFVTNALPLCFTGPVAAAYVGNAFIAVAALPARTTAKRKVKLKH